MILEKIPRIECVLTIPELIECELDNLISEFSSSKKSTRILKKYKKRIKTFNYFKNMLDPKNTLGISKSSELASFDNLNSSDSLSSSGGSGNLGNLGNLGSSNSNKAKNKANNKANSELNSSEHSIILKIFGNTDMSLIEKNLNEDFFNSFVLKMNDVDKMILTKFIISNIDKLINKYIKILVHIDDQIYILSKQNKDSKKIFLKFFFPKIVKDSVSGENIFDGTINSLRDNIHMTLLPTMEGHGLDGLFHLTFRIEGKKSSIFDYSKFISLNIDANKLGVGIYPDEKCINALIFKIIQNLSKLVELIKSNDFSNLDTYILNMQIYTNMLEFLTLDILKELNIANKIDYIYHKYFYSLGKTTIKTIIDKLFKIVILTFVELCFGIDETS